MEIQLQSCPMALWKYLIVDLWNHKKQILSPHHWQTHGWNENECQRAFSFCGKHDFLIKKLMNCCHSRLELAPSEYMKYLWIIFSTTQLEKLLNFLLHILPLHKILKRFTISWMPMKSNWFQDEKHTLRCFCNHLNSIHNYYLYNLKVNNFQNVYRTNHNLLSLQYILRSFLQPSNEKS